MTSCTDSLLTVNDAYKRVNYPGIQTAKPFIKYTLEFKAKTNFTINEVKLNDTDKIESFQLFSIEKKANVNSTAENQEGSYVLSFKIFDVDKKDNIDEVFIYAESSNKKYKQKVLIEKKEPFRAR